MKLYTEETVRNLIGRLDPLLRGNDWCELFDSLIPIELPSDEEIDAIANDIGHNYFVMQRNHYEGLIEGSRRMAYMLMKRFKQEDNDSKRVN